MHDRDVHGSNPLRFRWVIVLLAVMSASAVAYWQYGRWKFDSLIQQAEASLENRDYQAGLAHSEAAIAWRDRSEQAWLLAARSQLGLGNITEAMEALDRVPLVDEPAVLDVYADAANAVAFELHEPSRGEALYRQVLDVAPTHDATIAGLVAVLHLTGREWEAIPHVMDLIRSESFQVDHLKSLLDEGESAHRPELSRQWLAAQPDDPLSLLAWGAHLLSADETSRADEAIDVLRRAIKRDPDYIAAHALLGTALVGQHHWDDLPAWHANLPDAADEWPSVWIVRARWTEAARDTVGAVRCYAEAIRLNPNLFEANRRIGELLHELDEPRAASPFFKRSENLLELAAREAVLRDSEWKNLRAMRRLAEQLAVLGRVWEAWGWSRVALEIDRDATWPNDIARDLAPSLESNPPWTLVGVNPVRDFDIDAYPLPNWESLTVPTGTMPPTGGEVVPADVPITFSAVGPEAGLDFQFFNSGDPTTPGQYMYEFTGGGVAVLDFDGDRWPDLYFTQGGRWPVQTGQREFLDRLYRNNAARNVRDVTASASIVEDRFSQGVAAGDINNDGFPDLFVANIGRNRLLINNGDGTFDEQALPDDPGRWTTSCAIADLNGDSWPDIYAANYVDAPDVFTRMCRHPDGVAKMCGPLDFEGSPDEFYLNFGDGTFVEAAHLAGLHDEGGKGLGVVVADLNGNGQLDVFVANDLIENFYFVNHTPRRGEPPEFSEQGVLLGLAYGMEGGAQGCMGIAVGDANGDQRLDLFVTNFLMEPNAFYVQYDDGSFSDKVHQVGLYAPSMHQLGFGTQFIDADLDGRLDLIVTNGHIDDERDYGRPYHMPPQFFYNVGAGKFRELPADRLGPYFEGTYLGRGLATCDWNRDGAEDAVISHVVSPAALLTNSSPDRGHFVALHLRGTKSARDAIGTTVRLKLGETVLYRQLTTGDGYYASNERLLVFGLGKSTAVDELEIRWPTGEIERFTDVSIDRHFFVIEGADTLVPY